MTHRRWGYWGDWKGPLCSEESAVGPVEGCTQAAEKKVWRALADLCCVSSHSKDYGRRYRFSRGRGHDWTLRLGEKRIPLIIIPRCSEEAACWPRARGWKRVSTSARRSQIVLCISSTTLPSFVKTLNPSPPPVSWAGQRAAGVPSRRGGKLLTPLWFNLSCPVRTSTQTRSQTGEFSKPQPAC